MAFNQALCGLYAAGLGLDRAPRPRRPPSASAASPCPAAAARAAPRRGTDDRAPDGHCTGRPRRRHDPRARACSSPTCSSRACTCTAGRAPCSQPLRRRRRARLPAGPAGGPPALEPVVITGAALGLPGVEQVFDDDNVARILAGQQFIDASRGDDARADGRHAHHPAGQDASPGAGSFATIDDPADVIKLAGVHAPLDVVEQFGVDQARDEALDTTPGWPSAPGFDALRDAGIPLVMQLQDHDARHPAARPLGAARGAARRHRRHLRLRLPRLRPLRRRRSRATRSTAAGASSCWPSKALRARMSDDDPAAAEVDGASRRAARDLLETEPYEFDRRFLFRVPVDGALPVRRDHRRARPEHPGQRRLREHDPGAVAGRGLDPRRPLPPRGRRSPPTTPPATRCCRGSAPGFLASGAAATDDVVEDAATPFDRRRHGMIVGMGAAAFVVESADAARERGIQPICEVLGTVTANSAFHGTRLDVEHIGERHGGARPPRPSAAASTATQSPRSTVFVSHETYTPARGGSAAAEINALRRVVRRRRRPDRDHQHQGLHRPRDGRRHRGRRRRQGPGDRHRPAGARTSRSPTPSWAAEPVPGRRLPGASTRCGSPPASARRSP